MIYSQLSRGPKKEKKKDSHHCAHYACWCTVALIILNCTPMHLPKAPVC